MKEGKKTYCNPLDLGYRYQHINEGGKKSGNREGADPTLILFHGKYYLFVSMSAGFWYSDDLLNWDFHPNENLLIYDYAPDVRQIGEYLYFSASRRERNCPILRTKDPLSDEFEEVSAPFPFWDPDLFEDEDGRVYFYWGCTNTDPIYGVEMDRETMLPKSDVVPLIWGRETELGYERAGENGVSHKEDSLVYQHLKKLVNPETGKIEVPEMMAKKMGYNQEALQKMFDSIGRPYIEGAFMTKHDGRYYLQYACPGTEYNTYSDGVYVSDKPLGPFTLQKSNPFSSKPGGFITGAGHGSTIQDKYGNYWHASTMRISVNHSFERRVGIFPAFFDEDGILYSDQNFADYPHLIPQEKNDPSSVKPEWMLLSYKKPITVSSTLENSNPSFAVDEDIRTWWSAGSENPGEWITLDLEKGYDVRAIQVNFADDSLIVDFPIDSYGDERKTRHIETKPQITQYKLEISSDGKNWRVLENVEKECSNSYHEYLDGVRARFIKVTGVKFPYNQRMRISGLRVFGIGDGPKPEKAKAVGERVGDMDAVVSWNHIPSSQGCNVRYGINPDKLYMSWIVYDSDQVKLSTLIKGQEYYVAVDSFNENGITKGDVFKLK